MKRWVSFLSYHNAVPITLTILISGAGATFAATNPETIYRTTEKVLSVDNSYLIGKDLKFYTPRIEITSVTEDADNYYVSYRLTTIDVVNAVWQDVTTNEQLTVAKGVLGPYGDLGLYVTEQLKQVIDRQVAYLREVQEIEKKQPSLKSVATIYGGLVGKFLDDTTETLPGYIPVVTPPEPPPPQLATAVLAVPPSPQPQPQPEPPPPPAQSEQSATNPESADPERAPQPGASAPSETSPDTDTSQPVVQLLGDNPAQITVGETYTDLGVVVTDNDDHALMKFVNGVEVDVVEIDTSAPAEFEIRYEATDTSGNTGSAVRSVVVAESLPAENEATTTPAISPPSSAEGAAPQEGPPPPTPEPVPAPAPAPEPSPALPEPPPADPPQN